MPLGGFRGAIPQMGFKNFTSKTPSVSNAEGGSPSSGMSFERQGLRLQGESALQSKGQEGSGLRASKFKGY